MKIFLIHGMGRTAASMLPLGMRLAKAGHAPSYFGYSVTRHTPEWIAQLFAAHVRRVIARDRAKGAAKGGEEPYAIVGHSLGGIITRLGAAEFPRGFSRFVMLGPPNRPPVLAQTFGENPLFRAATREAGQRLRDDSFYAALPNPNVPTLVIAGNSGPKAKWLPFRGAPSDGVVLVSETHLDGACHREIPGVHTFLMNHAETARMILEFVAQ